MTVRSVALPVSVTGRVIAGSPSATAVVGVPNVTDGGSSLSVIDSVCADGTASVALPGLLSVSTTVSVASSSRASSTTVIGMVWVVSPGANVSVPLPPPVMSLLAAVPVCVKSTVTVRSEAADSCTVCVAAATLSSWVAAALTNDTVGLASSSRIVCSVCAADESITKPIGLARSTAMSSLFSSRVSATTP